MAKAIKAVAVAVAELFGLARIEALVSEAQLSLSRELVDVIAGAKIAAHDTQSICRSIVARVFPVGHEPDKATFTEFVAGVSEEVANLCFTTVAPVEDETEAQASKRFSGFKLYAAECVRKAYKEPEQDDGTIGERALPDAGHKVDGAVPPGMNAKKAAKGFASRVTSAIEYSAKLSDYPFDGAMLIRVAKWATEAAALVDALTADAAESMGEKKVA